MNNDNINLGNDDERDSFVISIDRNGKIRNFPILIRDIISKIIFDNVREYPDRSNKDLIDTIVKILEEENSADQSINDFKSKINSNQYGTSIKNLLNDLVIIIREINNCQEDIINITHLTNRILENNFLTTYETFRSIYDISRQIIDYLHIKRLELNINTEERNRKRELRRIETYKKYQKIATDRGGNLKTSIVNFLELTENEEHSNKVRLNWTCDKYPEHRSFWTTVNNITTGSWCPTHFRERQKKRQIDKIGYKYERLQDIAHKHGGELLTPKRKFEIIIKSIKPSRALLEWACKKYPNHSSWDARPHDIINKNGWCPECASGKYEKICRWYFKQIFKSRYPKTTLRSLNLNIDNFNCLNDYDAALLDDLISYGHFDGYNTIIINDCQYILAFEYNGYQHYEFPNQYHKNNKTEFDDQQIRDSLKLQISNDNNIILIVFPYYISERMNEPKKIQNYIIEEFERKTNIKLPQMRQFEFVDDDDDD